MEANLIKTWEAFVYQEKVYSLEHLTEFEWEYIQAASGDKPERRYPFIVEFGLHCFTYAPNEHKGETLAHYDANLFYKDSRETRIFSFSRYKLSSSLPDIAKEIGVRNCYHTGKGNFFTIDVIDENGNKQEYEVYFNVARSSAGKLRLFVESAFIRDDEHNSSQPKKKKINFFVIAHNRKMNKQIKTPN